MNEIISSKIPNHAKGHLHDFSFNNYKNKCLSKKSRLSRAKLLVLGSKF